MCKMKNILDRIARRCDTAKQEISGLEEIAIETIAVIEASQQIHSCS